MVGQYAQRTFRIPPGTPQLILKQIAGDEIMSIADAERWVIGQGLLAYYEQAYVQIFVQTVQRQVRLPAGRIGLIMSEEKALVVVEQREIPDFYGDYIVAVLSEEGKIFVLCDNLYGSGCALECTIRTYPAQSDFVRANYVCSCHANRHQPSSRAPRSTLMTTLPLDYLNGWLFGIDANRVKLEIRIGCCSIKENVMRCWHSICP